MTDIEKQELVGTNDSEVNSSTIVSKKTSLCENLCDNHCWKRWTSIHPCIRLFLLVALIVPWIMVYLVFTDFTLTGTSASIHYKDKCNGEFGCCEVYDKCEDKGTYLDGHSSRLDQLAHDALKSDCPSLEYLVNKYNHKYFPKNHDCGEFGCCDSIEVTCDNAMRTTVENGNNHGTVELFRENRKILPILNPKKDAQGSNCDHYGTTYDIISSYNNNYPPKEMSWVEIIFICFIILFVVVPIIKSK